MDETFTKYFLNNDWVIQGEKNSAIKHFQFKDFKTAFSWMTIIAIIAEKQDHHPEWKNIYNKVEVVLTTHDEGGLSKKDLYLAKAVDNEFKKYS